MRKQSVLNAVLLMNVTILSMAALGMASSASASEEVSTSATSSDVSPRMSNRLGTYLGVGEPAPGILGINVAYNIMDALRADLGYSSISTSAFGVDASATTLGAGLTAMIPGWRFTPTAGVHYGHISYTGSGLEVNGFSESGGHVYGSAGLDYQGKSGFNAGLGYNYSLKSGIGASGYVQLGWFFNVHGT